MTRPCLAAITLDAKGGGVALVSRLLWRVFSDRWGDHSRLITLLEDSGPLESLDSSTATRLRFGTTLAGGQAFGQCPWVFYSHLSVARVQSFVPPPFPGTIVCGNPAHGLPPVPPDPNGRASYSFLLFDLDGNLTGNVHMIRADLYAGQPCPQTGGLYVLNPANGYYRCGL